MSILGHVVYAIVAATGAFCVYAFALWAFYPSPVLSTTRVLDLAKKYAGSDSDQPLFGKVVIVTGSTAGLGLAIATELYRVYCTAPHTCCRNYM